MLLNWCWRRLLRVLWTARRSSQSILKEISPEYSLEGLMVKLKLQYFGHLMGRPDSLEQTDAGKNWRQEDKGTTEHEMVGWYHWLNGHEIEQAPGVGDGRGNLACFSPWGHKQLDMIECLNWLNGLIKPCIAKVSVLQAKKALDEECTLRSKLVFYIRKISTWGS